MVRLFLHLDPEKEHEEATTVEWIVRENKGEKILQKGKLFVAMSNAFGSYEEIQKIPVSQSDDFTQEESILLPRKNVVHMRNTFWKVFLKWKTMEEPLFIVVKGGWEIWSHFLHRLIHDDFAARKAFKIEIVHLDSLQYFDLFNR